MTHELTPFSFNPSPGSLENADLDNDLWIRKLLLKSRLSEKMQHSVGEENMNFQFVCIEVGKRNSLILPKSLFPKAAEFRTKRALTQSVISPVREGERLQVITGFPCCVDSAKEVNFSSTPSREVNGELHDLWGWGSR